MVNIIPSWFRDFKNIDRIEKYKKQHFSAFIMIQLIKTH